MKTLFNIENLKPNFFISLVLAAFLMILSGCNKEDIESVLEETFDDIYEEDLSFKVVGYFPWYRFYAVDEINFDQVDYVNIAFGNLNASGDLVVGNGEDISIIVQKIKSTNAKVMLSIAGGGDTGNYWVKYLSDSEREDCIKRMVAFTVDYNLDGIDVDIEGALITSLGVNYNLFVQELRVRLHAKGKAITAALTPTYLDPVITNKTLNSFDFINIMAYDATGPWNPNAPGQHSPYSLAVDALNFWTSEKGIPKERLILGVPFYGRDFEPSNLTARSFSQIVGFDFEYAYVDEVGLLYYNGIPTIVDKTKLALQNANGVMIWELGQDEFTDLSLLSAIYQVVESDACEINNIRTYYKDKDGDGLGDLMFPLQSCDPPTGYVNNKNDLDDDNPVI